MQVNFRSWKFLAVAAAALVLAAGVGSGITLAFTHGDRHGGWHERSAERWGAGHGGGPFFGHRGPREGHGWMPYGPIRPPGGPGYGEQQP